MGNPPIPRMGRGVLWLLAVRGVAGLGGAAQAGELSGYAALEARYFPDGPADPAQFEGENFSLAVSLTLFLGISSLSPPPQLDPDIEAVMAL